MQPCHDGDTTSRADLERLALDLSTEAVCAIREVGGRRHAISCMTAARDLWALIGDERASKAAAALDTWNAGWN